MSNYEYLIESEITCPYCKFEYGDSWEMLGDGEGTEVLECPECYKKFIATRHITVDYWCTPDCEENGEKHQYKKRNEQHKGKDIFDCVVCGDIAFKIQSKELSKGKE